jgi:PiT family inorganic phosphate transporter
MALWTGLILLATLFVAYANGANDNFKGVATLFGSETAGYRTALWWATGTTFLGSLAALLFSSKLITMFQGKGFIPPVYASAEPFVVSVILGAALTVFFAARIGIPISTTHSLTGALVGSGVSAAGAELNYDFLGKSFFLPLLFSPLVSVVLVMGLYPLLRRLAARLAITKETCVCAGQEWMPVSVSTRGVPAAAAAGSLRIIIDQETECAQRYSGRLFGVNAQSLLDAAHFLSAGAVSFARGLNDTPKIVALGLSFGSMELVWTVLVAASVMALGGILDARKVAETLSRKITGMDHGQGFSANLITSFLVIWASKWGMPVSTTHVSCGALFGIGIVNGQAQWNVIHAVLGAWVLTLPFAGVTAAVIYAALSRLLLAV